MRRRKNPGSSAGTILTIGAVAVGGYFLYETFFANALPADAGYVAQVAAGQTVLVNGQSVTGPAYVYYSPSTKQYYSNSTAPTQAQITAGQAMGAGGSTGALSTSLTVNPTAGQTASSGGQVSTTVTTGGPPAAATTVEPPPQQALPSLTSIYSNVIAGASTDPNFTGAGDSLTSSGYRWNVYLTLSLPAGKSIPNIPGFDLSQNMTAKQYWAVMGPALTSAYGMSGFMAGLGAYARMRGMGDAFSDAFAAASGGVNVNVDAATNPAFTGDYPIGPVVQDSMTVTPSTAGTSYTFDPTTGAVLKVTPPTSSATTYLMLAAAGLFAVVLFAGRK